MASFWAGVTADLWYAFGALLLHLEVAGQLGLDRVKALPRSFVVTLAGLAILFTMHDSLHRSYSGFCRFGALVLFAVAAAPFKILGIPSSFWASTWRHRLFDGGTR